MANTVSSLLRTPLAASHTEAGARMVDFGGWQMPVNYGSQIEEHHAVRTDAGMFDVSHMCVVDLSGPDTRELLRRLVANNVDKLKVAGKALYTCMLNQQGGVVDDLIITFLNEVWFRLVINASTAITDISWIRAVIARSNLKVTLVPRRGDLASPELALAIIAVQGPQAREKFWRAVPTTKSLTDELKPFNAALVSDSTFGELMVSRTGYTGEDGFEIVSRADAAPLLWKTLSENGIRPAGLGARDTLRLEAGMNLYGQDMDETVSPLDAGLAWTVDLKSDREYMGRQGVEHRGVSAQTIGAVVFGEGGIPRAGQAIHVAGGEGVVTSGTFSPTMQRPIAIVRVPMSVKPGDELVISVRGRELAAVAVRLPFVRNGGVLSQV
ncbi:glycine cleavage system aminomethyltransferase GcvT [Caballeronia sp. LZ029]|uniref:glycine cleavage system aminomethyltransferase GcvT n=1 Tax=Caballeronia sp. LZ029 TaxID=3038564 RepID=UPI00285FC677|nr:glycine cleavage system aminomethyltransferase GcvT [Caballeronia sp. LZ029]MDR5749034.1 glycine cleavage system aminomethyltransferase GcvT [Caballeronia sp. LZ029]